MKKILFLLLSFSLTFVGCDSFLDRQPDETLTEQDIFKKQATTFAYLVNVYGFMPDESDPSGQTLPWEGAADECSVSYTGRAFASISHDLWSPATNPYYEIGYQNMWRGIREANYFMLHVYECPEITPTEASLYYYEARFLRAYYYFRLMMMYGPVFLIGDEPIDFSDKSTAVRERDDWESCVEYVCNECDVCAENLPLEWESTYYGRATKGAALAVKARLLLYSASPLYNGNPLYAGVIASNGKPLFPTTYDANKWKLAADAAMDIINLNQYEILGENDDKPYESLKNVFVKRCNKELIFTREVYGRPWRVVATPVGVGGSAYGGLGVTQKMVDAFAMSNGKYPIVGYTNDGATPVIDPDANYSETGFSNFTHPIYKDNLNTFKMYQNREPRFYVNVFWSGLTWHGGANVVKDIQFFRNGNSGPGQSAGHNYTTTGYLAHKFIDPTLNSKANNNTTGWGYISWPMFRFGEVILNYVEALNECDPTNTNVVTYLDRIRKRAGVPAIEDVYPTAVGDQAKMRELIHRERMVELCFENLRYFDTRRWLSAEVEDSGTVYGMNIENASHAANGDFWKRTPLNSDGGFSGVRAFTKRCYLFPFPQGEIDRVKFTQNYGW